MRVKLIWGDDALSALRLAAYLLFALCQFSATFLNGGVAESKWVWIGFAIALAALAAHAARIRRRSQNSTAPELVLLGILLAWFLFQLIPLPPALVEVLSPARWRAVRSARLALGADMETWLALSVAPAATFSRLLNVLPTMVAFLMAREAARWWTKGTLWALAAPLIVLAFLESVLGMLQSGMAADPAHGTYTNRDHFAGLLEMALPLTAAWAAALWWRPAKPEGDSLWRTAGIIALATAAACMFRALILSESRMGFFASVLALAIIVAGFLMVSRRLYDSSLAAWASPVPVLAILAIAGFASTSALLVRVADSASPANRMAMWRGTVSVIKTYPFTGVGLGAFEHAFYRFQSFMPGFTIDFAHNDYLQIFAELGLVGAILVLLLAGTIGWRLITALRHPHPENWLVALGTAGALVAIAFHSFVDFNLYIPANALAIAWLGGLAASPALQQVEAMQDELLEDDSGVRAHMDERQNARAVAAAAGQAV